MGLLKLRHKENRLNSTFTLYLNIFQTQKVTFVYV